MQLLGLATVVDECGSGKINNEELAQRVWSDAELRPAGGWVCKSRMRGPGYTNYRYGGLPSC